MVKRRKRIVILGAGFAGLKIAQALQKGLNHSFEVTIVDKQIFNLYTPDLYEIASAFNKQITDQCLINLKETIATPIDHLVDTHKMTFLNDEVLKIDPAKRKIKLKKGGRLHYDILACTLGAATNYFRIPGLKEHSFPLKTIRDAIAINCYIDHYIKHNWQLGKKKTITITIGGGGATGVETAAEMVGSLRLLSKKYNYPRKKLRIQLIEGSNYLAAMPPRGTKMIMDRFKKLGIKVHINSFIKKVTKEEITLKLKRGTKIVSSDILIWTGGVKINPIVTRDIGTAQAHGAIPLNQYLQSPKHPEIFAAGDSAYFPDPRASGHRTPLLAQVAIEQGKVVAKNILAQLKGKQMKAYETKALIMLLPIGGRLAILKTQKHIFKSCIFWYLRRLVGLRYSLSILPFWRAITMWHKATKLFMMND